MWLRDLPGGTNLNMQILTYAASFVLCGWGVAHLFPTRNIVRGFGEISADNKRIITMEWITEGVALVFIGFVVAATTYLDGASILSKVIYSSTIVVLCVLSVVSVFTGFRNSFVAFKLCPVIFTGSSIMMIVGSLVD
jgi:hypothetical protein